MTSTDTIRLCVARAKASTFMSDSLCSACRNAGKPKSEKPGEKR